MLSGTYRESLCGPAFGLALVSLVCSLAGCGSNAAPGGTTPVGPSGSSTPAITLATSSSSVTTGQSLTVTVTASAGSGAAPTGTVVVSSGSYATFPASLSAGNATFTIPAGLLPAGTDLLTAAFTPASSTAYSSASGTASVTVTTANAAMPTVTGTSVTYPTSGAPFRALPTASGKVLVSVTGTASGIQVFAPAAGGGLQSSCTNPLPAGPQAILGMNLFGNGASLAAAVDNYGALFLNTAAVQNCSAAGTLVSQGSVASGQGSFDITVTPDGKYAFVANEYGIAAGSLTEGNIGVIALQYDASGNVLPASTLLGQIATGGNAIAGVLLSPDGSRLYVTSEVAADATTASGSNNPVLARTGCIQASGGSGTRNGLLTVIDVAKAEATPGSSAVLATVDSGCSPVRMVETADLSTLWVSARGDNRVLAFSTGMLESNASNSLMGYADTGGTAPVGLQLFHSQQLLAVANSNRFGTGTGTAPANLTVLNIASPYTAAVVQTFATGLFPREVTAGSDDATLYLTNYSSGSFQVISTTVR